MSELEKEILCQSTDEVICPHCGYSLRDSWDLQDDHGKLECDECGKEFEYYRQNLGVVYSTYKTEKKDETAAYSALKGEKK